MKDLYKKFESDGYVIIDKFFSESDLGEFEAALQKVISSEGVDIYKDRSGNLRRLEHFTRKNRFFLKLDEQIRDFLKDISGFEYQLFKDKINFKPSGGEGFYAHYDGVFRFDDGIATRDGWYEYADAFVNVLIAIDDFTIENGALEVARIHKGSFEELLQNTKKNGSPDLIDSVVSKCQFIPALVKKGGIVIFSNLCPHQSGPNKSSAPRGSIYFTYNDRSYGDNYERYFVDKKNSSNPFKALTGEIK